MTCSTRFHRVLKCRGVSGVCISAGVRVRVLERAGEFCAFVAEDVFFGNAVVEVVLVRTVVVDGVDEDVEAVVLMIIRFIFEDDRSPTSLGAVGASLL